MIKIQKQSSAAVIKIRIEEGGRTMNKNTKFTLIMLTSLLIVAVITSILCLVNLSSVGKTVLVLLDTAAAVTFAICPTLALREEELEKKQKMDIEVRKAA